MRPPRMRSAGLLAAVAAVAVLAATPARADTVTDWNVNATDALVTTAGQAPTVSTIHLAMVHGAVFDAVNSIDRGYEPYLVRVPARSWYSKDAAAATSVRIGCSPRSSIPSRPPPPSWRSRMRSGGRSSSPSTS